MLPAEAVISVSAVDEDDAEELALLDADADLGRWEVSNWAVEDVSVEDVVEES